MVSTAQVVDIDLAHAPRHGNYVPTAVASPNEGTILLNSVCPFWTTPNVLLNHRPVDDED